MDWNTSNLCFLLHFWLRWQLWEMELEEAWLACPLDYWGHALRESDTNYLTSMSNCPLTYILVWYLIESPLLVSCDICCMRKWPLEVKNVIGREAEGKRDEERNKDRMQDSDWKSIQYSFEKQRDCPDKFSTWHLASPCSTNQFSRNLYLATHSFQSERIWNPAKKIYYSPLHTMRDSRS